MTAPQELINNLPELKTPISELPPLAGWKEIPIVETDRSHEPLVPLGMFSDHANILTSSTYADEHNNSPYPDGLEGSSVALFAREGVAEKLDTAASLLPRGKYLMVMDGYRSLQVQGSLFEQYSQSLADQHPDWSDEEISTETQKYVSIPSTDPTRPSPHNTGASIDTVIIEVNDTVQTEIETIDVQLSSLDKADWQTEYLLEMRKNELLRRNGKMLNFGTRFDYGGPEAGLRYLEEKSTTQELTDEEQTALENRRLLYSVMTSAGFEPYDDEWWHYNDPASQMGAKIAGHEFAEYGAATLSEDNQAFAEMREAHHLNSVAIARGEEWTPPQGLEAHYALARQAFTANNPRNIFAMTGAVEKIEPPKNSL
jgi:D-alanyl-D-alanine dipeptidase